MSWEGYIDHLIAKSNDGSVNHISQATIIGLNGGAVWTPKTKDTILNISADEARLIASRMAKKNDSVASDFQGTGILVDGIKYFFLRDLNGDGRTMLGKKTEKGSLTMQSTNQAIIIAFTPEGSSQGVSNKAVDDVAKFLSDSGY